MNNQIKFSKLRTITIIALVLFAASVVAQVILGRTEYPPIPPAVIISLFAAGCLVFAQRKKWAGIVAFFIPFSLIIGVTAWGWYQKLFQPETTAYLAIWLQWISLLIAVIGSALLLFTEYFKKSTKG